MNRSGQSRKVNNGNRQRGSYRYDERRPDGRVRSNNPERERQSQSRSVERDHQSRSRSAERDYQREPVRSRQAHQGRPAEGKQQRRDVTYESRPVRRNPDSGSYDARRRSSGKMTKRERLRRKKQQKMTRIIVAVVMLILLCGAGFWWFFGSGSAESADDKEEQALIENELDLSKRGRIVGVINESFEEAYYSESDLKTMIEKEISGYNSLTGVDKAVSMDDFAVENGLASVSLLYKTDDDYRAFNNVNVYTGKVSKLLEDGELSPIELMGYETEEKLTPDTFNKVKKRRAVITSEPGLVKTSGKILFHSSNVEVIKDKLARVTLDEESESTMAVIIYK